MATTNSKSVRWILAAVDGTLSQTYQTESNKSAVWRFFDDFKCDSGDKLYWEGPGVSAEEMRRNPVLLNTARTTEELMGRRPDGQSGVVNLVQGVRRWLDARYTQSEDPREIRLVLCGHSRGGLVVLQVAKELNEQNPVRIVEFMALYDAVDMARAYNVDTVPPNVKRSAHAIRSYETGSRDEWGNCGLQRDASRNAQEQFEATHGSIGGFPPHACRGKWKVRGFSDVLLWQSPAWHIYKRGDELIDDTCNEPLDEATNSREGREADEFIRGEALAAGIPI